MIETEYFIYPQTEKTGSTYVAHVLHSLLGADWHPKHQRIPNNFSIGQRKVLATIRNPWAWYVSAFSFGCAEKGKIYQRIMKQPHLREHHWKEDFVAGFKSFFLLYLNTANSVVWKLYMRIRMISIIFGNG